MDAGPGQNTCTHRSDQQTSISPSQRRCSLQMTNLLSVLPEFDIRPFTHILPSLEKALISTADLLSLDAVDVAKRASVPTGEVKKLASALLESLHSKFSVSNGPQQNGTESADAEVRPDDHHDAATSVISTLDERM